MTIKYNNWILIEFWTFFESYKVIVMTIGKFKYILYYILCIIYNLYYCIEATFLEYEDIIII